MKKCKMCKKKLDESMFSKNGKYLSSYCKQCCKENQKKYVRKDDRSKYQKDYQKKYRDENRKDISKKESLIRNAPAQFSIGIDLVEKIEDRGGLLFVECKQCGKMHNPKYVEVMSRLSAIRGNRDTNCYFYCSNTCKKSCSLYYKRESGYIKDYLISIGMAKAGKSRKATTGEVYAINFAKSRDGNRCTVCGSECDLEGHHIIPYKILIGTDDEYLIEDTDNIKTVCKSCHLNIEHTGDISVGNLAKIESKKSICATK